MRVVSSTALLTLSVLIAFSVPIAPAHAIPEIPRDKWAPVGPFISEILIKHYATTGAEFLALANKDIDLTDSPLGPSMISQLLGSPDHEVSYYNSEFGFFDIEFNLANTHFGIPFEFGRNPAGVNVRQAVAHLIDKKAHVAKVVEGLGDPIDNMLAPAQIPAGTQPLPDFHLFDLLHGPQTISAFNLADDPNPAPAVDSPDWVAAKEHLLAAGFVESTVTTPGGNKLLNPPPSLVDFCISFDDPVRTALGHNLAQAWNSLFAGGNGGINIVRPPVDLDCASFAVLNTDNPLDWHWYTGSHRVGPEWHHLFSLYHSIFASDACGGEPTVSAENHIFACISALDDKLAGTPYGSGGLFFSYDLTTSLNFATQALLIMGQQAVTVPVWSGINRFGYLNGWQGIIDAKGVGPPNFYTLLNAFCGTPAPGSAYLTTTCPTGADAAQGRLRWGFRQGTTVLNLFGARSQSEFLILDQIYGSLLTDNPYNPLQLTSNAANKWQVFQDGLGLGYIPPSGTRVSLRFLLRPNVFFHDGVTKLTAKDVKFTVLNYRDLHSGEYFSHAVNIIDVTILSNTLVDIHLNAKGPFWESTIGFLPILNSRLWDTNNDGAVDTGLERSDVVVNGILANDGFGPYRFVSTTGGDQAIVPGDATLLQAFKPAVTSAFNNQYFRASGIFKNFAWADFDSGSGLKVDIMDIASVAACFGRDVVQNPSCAFWDTVAGGNGEAGHTPLVGAQANVVDIVEFSAVASYYGQQWLFPPTWSPTNYVLIQSFPFIPPT